MRYPNSLRLPRKRSSGPLLPRSLRLALYRFRALILLALGALLLGAGLLSAAPREGRVLVAAQDVPAGTVLSAEHLKTVPGGGGAADLGLLSQADQAVGRRTLHVLERGNAVSRQALSAADRSELEPGETALAVTVPAVEGTRLRPGDPVLVQDLAPSTGSAPVEEKGPTGKPVRGRVLGRAESSQDASASGRGPLGGSSNSTQGRESSYLVAVPESEAPRLAAGQRRKSLALLPASR